MKGNCCSATSVRSRLSLLLLVLGIGLIFSTTALGFTVNLDVQGMPKKTGGLTRSRPTWRSEISGG